MSNIEQPFLDNFLKVEAEARESMITEYERQLHLARQFCRYEKQLRVCKSSTLKRFLEKAKQDVIRLMERG